MQIFSLNIFLIILMSESYHQKHKGILAATGMNGLTLMLLLANLANTNL